MDTIDMQITDVQRSTLGALPAVILSATAKRGSVSADVKMSAVLVPVRSRHEFRVSVHSLAPVVRVYSLEVSLLPFVQRLLKLQVIDQGLPTIRLPILESISIGGPAGTASGRMRKSTDRGLHPRFITTVPATAWTGRITPQGLAYSAD